MRVTIWTLTVLAGMGMSLAVSAQTPRQPVPVPDIVLRSIPDGPVALVNDSPIPKDQYKAAYQSELLGLMTQMPSGSIDDVVRVQTGIHALKMLIQRELLFQEAAKRKITISDAEVNTQWNTEIEGMKRGFHGEKDKAPTESDILKMVGTTRESAMAQLRRGLIIDAVVEQLANEKKITVSDDEVSKYFNENKEKMSHPDLLHIKQIFISKGIVKGAPVDEQKRTAAREATQKALQRVRAGESFEAVAKAVSQSPTKDKGGDLGALPTTALPKAIADAANKMKPGETSDVIEGDEGFSVINLVKAIPGEGASFEKMGPEIRKLLLAQKKNKLVEDFCDPVMAKPGNIQVYLQLEKLTATNPDFMKFRKNVEAQAKNAPAPKGSAETPKKNESTPKSAAKKTTKKTEKKPEKN